MDTTPVKFRRAGDADIPELARLVAAIAAWHEALDARARFDWNEIRAAPSWLPAVLHRDHHAVWVVENGAGGLAGYLWVHLRRDRQGYLPQLRGYINQAYLDEGWRGKGLMRPLLAEAYAWFRARGVTIVTLTVLQRNWLGSTAWYKHGFEDWTQERRIDLETLAKRS